MDQITAHFLSVLARQQKDIAVYRCKSTPEAAPYAVDCSSFVQWLYSQVGIQLPRLAFEQFHACRGYVPARMAQPGNLVFMGGSAKTSWHTCPLLGADHVGFVSTDLTVIHAANAGREVVEDPLDLFTTWRQEKHSQVFCAGRVL